MWVIYLFSILDRNYDEQQIFDYFGETTGVSVSPDGEKIFVGVSIKDY